MTINCLICLSQPIRYNTDPFIGHKVLQKSALPLSLGTLEMLGVASPAYVSSPYLWDELDTQNAWELALSTARKRDSYPVLCAPLSCSELKSRAKFQVHVELLGT